MSLVSISTKDIRHDLEGFLRRLKQGQVIQVLYRSKPLVTLAAKDAPGTHTAADAGTPAAARRSVAFVRSLPPRPAVFAPTKSFKDLYDETREL